VTPLEFRRDLWRQKTRIALSCGIKNIAGRFFGLVTKHACDRRTDGQNTTPKSQDRASIAVSRGKNHNRGLSESARPRVPSDDCNGMRTIFCVRIRIEV